MSARAPFTIRDAQTADEADWRRLWAAYLRFYEEPLPEAVTATTWDRILDPASSMSARFAATEAGLAGFCICVRHACTWTILPVCYLEDLFVEENRRHLGLGRALIDDAIRRTREAPCSRLYWHTRADNAAARRLYDTLAPADDVVRYTLRTG